MNERHWRAWKGPVETGGVLYPSAQALHDELSGAYMSDAKTREHFDSMAFDAELFARSTGGREVTLIVYPIPEIRGA